MLFNLSFLACSDKVDLDLLANKFSELECEAIKLREQRFALADTMRSIETDSSINSREKFDSLNIQKDLLRAKSLDLADSIKNELERLFREYLKNKTLKEQFYTKLKNQLKVKQCQSNKLLSD